MGGQTTSSSSPSSSESSQQDMEKFQHLSLQQPPPPRPNHLKCKKRHRHRHYHSCPSPPSSSVRCRRQVFEDTPLERPHHHKLLPPLGCSDHHHHKEGKLRVKPPKHLKKVHKLHCKIMKACKLPKNARHGMYHRHYMHFSPPEEGICSAPFCYYHPPGCCLHSSEAIGGSRVAQEMSFGRHRRCHGRYPHPGCPTCPWNKSDFVRGEVALMNPQAMEASAEPPIEAGTVPLTSDTPPVDVPAPVIQAP